MHQRGPFFQPTEGFSWPIMHVLIFPVRVLALELCIPIVREWQANFNAQFSPAPPSHQPSLLRKYSSRKMP